MLLLVEDGQWNMMGVARLVGGAETVGVTMIGGTGPARPTWERITGITMVTMDVGETSKGNIMKGTSPYREVAIF